VGHDVQGLAFGIVLFPELHHRIGQRRTRLRSRTVAVPVQYEEDLVPRLVEAISHERQVARGPVETMDQENGRPSRVDTPVRDDGHILTQGVEQARLGRSIDGGRSERRERRQGRGRAPGCNAHAGEGEERPQHGDLPILGVRDRRLATLRCDGVV
jgi:hypothetical protein